MNPNRLTSCMALAAAALFASTSVHADLVYQPYFASENINGNLANANTTIAARQNFLSMVTGAQTETFESFQSGTSTNGLKVFGGQGTILQGNDSNGDPKGVVTNVTDNGSGPTGRYNTTPPPACPTGTECNFLETAYSFTLDFGGNYSAFAFYGTDFSDFSGSISLDLLQRDPTTGQLVVVAGTHIVISGPAGASALNTSDGTGDGSLLNFGVTDNSRGYAGVAFTVNQGAGNTDPMNYDYLGWDDLVIGQYNAGSGGSVPEPGSLALAGLSLVALAAARRKSRV